MIVAMWHEQPRDFVCVLCTVPTVLRVLLSRPGNPPVMNTDRLPLTCTPAHLIPCSPADRELAFMYAALWDAP